MAKTMKKVVTMKAAMKKTTNIKKKAAGTKGKKKVMVKKKASIIAKGKMAKSAVFRGTKAKTVGGLKKTDLIKSKRGKVVSKKSSLHGEKAYKNVSKWTAATVKARKELKLKGFVPCGGNTARGKALLAKARSYYKK